MAQRKSLRLCISVAALLLSSAGVAATGCGGEERESAEPVASEVAATTSAPPDEAPPRQQDEGGPTPPIPSEAMVQQMLGQHVIDDPAVQPFLHLEVAANLPLRVWAATRLDEGAPRLRAGGQPVRVVETQSEARLQLTTRRELAGSGVHILFEIPAEGVSGHVHLELRDNVWHRVSSEAVER